jgi:uncharacterized protein (DUF2062 family)
MERTLPSAHTRALQRASRLQRAMHSLRTEGDSRVRESAAVGTGLLIGCTPFWGTHFLLCWGAGWLLRLNRLKVYLAANLINPLILPPLLYVEVQAGALVRRGQTRPLSWEAFRSLDPWQFGADLVVGSLLVGLVLGCVAAAITFAARRPTRDPFFRSLARRAADRYLATGIVAWEFARGKTTGDPVCRHVLEQEVSGGTGTLVDLGCGQGLMLALIAEAAATSRAGDWDPGRPAPPAFSRLIGIEMRPRIARIAVRALDGEAEISRGDIRDTGVPPCDVVLIFDVLHLLAAEDQESMLRAVHEALPPGGRLLVREADASAGWRFWMVRLGNRIKAIVTRDWRQRFAFRTAEEWMRVLETAGFHTMVRPMGAGTPFGNVLLVGRKPDEQDDLV